MGGKNDTRNFGRKYTNNRERKEVEKEREKKEMEEEE